MVETSTSVCKMIGEMCKIVQASLSHTLSKGEQLVSSQQSKGGDILSPPVTKGDRIRLLLW